MMKKKGKCSKPKQNQNLVDRKQPLGCKDIIFKEAKRSDGRMSIGEEGNEKK